MNNYILQGFVDEMEKVAKNDYLYVPEEFSDWIWKNKPELNKELDKYWQMDSRNKIKSKQMLNKLKPIYNEYRKDIIGKETKKWEERKNLPKHGVGKGILGGAASGTVGATLSGGLTHYGTKPIKWIFPKSKPFFNVLSAAMAGLGGYHGAKFGYKAARENPYYNKKLKQVLKEYAPQDKPRII